MKDRLLALAGHYGLSVRAFEQACGLMRGNIGNMSDNGTIGADKLSKIVDRFPSINSEWLLTGDGSMHKYELLEAIEKSPTDSNYAIPFVSLNAVAGFGSADFKIEATDVKAYYVVPKFRDRKIDFMIEVAGSSMYPKYNSGDVIACKIIRESRFIQWNRVHVIATKEQGLVVKRIKENGDDSILAISDNKDYPPFVIPKDEITGIALVVGVIRLE